MQKGILIIGAGGVSRVATVKCAMNIDTFEKITLASRTVSKCESIRDDIKKNQGVSIDVASINADSVEELVALIKKVNPKLVLNVALPYQDLTIMDACTKCKVDYVDTAN